MIRNEGIAETHPRWGRHLCSGHGWSDALRGILVAKQADAAVRDAICIAPVAPDAGLRATALLELGAWLGDQTLGPERLAAWLASGLVKLA